MARFVSARPGPLLAAGALLTGLLAALEAANLGGLGEFFQDLYVVVSAGFVVVALAVMARRPGLAILSYWRLTISVVSIGAGMLALDLHPIYGQSAAAVASNCLFALGATLSSSVIIPALYRQMDRRAKTMALFDGGIMMSAGTTIALTVWRTGQGSGPAQLFMPLVAAGLLASAGVAVTAALNSRRAPAIGGVWTGIVAVCVLGFSWALLVDSAMRGQGRDGTTSLVYSVGILLLGFGWVTWSDQIAIGDTYSRIARSLGDWLPVGAIAVCVAADSLPHGRIEGIDAINLGTAGVVLFSVARQRLLLSRERETSHHLVGEERLRAEKEAAELANRAKSAFLAMMSHEIRTPMNAILGNATLLSEAELGPGERESVEAIESAGEALLAVINDVLDFSKIEAERMELERVGFAPATLIGSVVSLFGAEARTAGLKLTADIDPSIPVILAGDPHRLHQILTNLVGNAIKFTAEGGVCVRARVMDRSPEATLLRFEVADTGIGISDEARARLFAPFVQVDASTTRRFGGSGLGLAICKSLVGLMGGEINVDSLPGEGSTFWFTIRLPAPTDTEAGAVLEANEFTDRTVDTIGARVLIAEDNQANVRLIERLLGRLGIETEIAGNGIEALDAVREGTFDLVLMDCHMPKMDGLDATRAIRAAGYDIPIVALTANATGNDRTACFTAGMNDYLSKPVRPADLAAALRRWLPNDEELTLPGPLAASLAAGTIPAELVEVIDQGQMAELFALDPDGSAGFFAAMVDSYRATTEETLPSIRAAVAASDWELLEEAAHKLKGVAANLGVRRVYEAAARLVALARVGEGAGEGSGGAGSAGVSSDGAPILADLEAALAPADEALTLLLVHVSAGVEMDEASAARDAA